MVYGGGEYSPAANEYKKGSLMPLMISGMIIRGDGTFQIRDAISHLAQLPAGVIIGNDYSQMFDADFVAVKISATQSKILVFKHVENGQKLAEIVVTHGTIAKIGVHFKEVNTAGLLSVNTPASTTVVFVTGLGINLKYIDSSYTLKDFKINNGTTTNTPVVTHLGAMQQRLLLTSHDRIMGAALKTISGDLITCSKVGQIDYFMYEGGVGVPAETLALSAFEVAPSQWTEPHDIWGIIVERKQVVVLTNIGLSVAKALDEEAATMSDGNKLYYTIDRAPSLPILPVVFANYLTYATEYGLRYRPYAFVSGMYSPQVDPGCYEIPTAAEEIENITDIRVVPYYNIMAVVADGVVYAYHQPKVVELGGIANYMRTTLFKSNEVGVTTWGAKGQVFFDRELGGNFIGFSDRSKGYLNVGAQSYTPKLTIASINGRQITITLNNQDVLSNVYIKLSDASNVYTLFYKNTPTTYATDDTTTPISTGSKVFFPATTINVSYFLPPTTTLSSSYWYMIGTIGEYKFNLSVNNTFELPEEILQSTSAVIKATYYHYLEEAKITFESDVPSGMTSSITEVRMSFSAKTHDFFKISPTPKEDQKAGTVEERKSYAATVRTNFSSTNNMFNVTLTPYNLNSGIIYLYRIFALTF